MQTLITYLTTMRSAAVLLCIAALTSLPPINGDEEEDYQAILRIFSKPLDTSRKLDTVGFECTIKNVAFPEMYLHMKHYVLFYDDQLRLRQGDPKNTTNGEWDWSGIWTIQYFQSNLTSNITDLVMKDHENNQFATFSPGSRTVFTPVGLKTPNQGSLWNLDVKPGPEGTVTAISIAQPLQGFPMQKLFLRAVTLDGQNSTKEVILDNIFYNDLSRWKVTCHV